MSERVTPAGRNVAFRAMGSACQITFTAPSKTAGDFFRDSVLQWLAEFEARYSRFLGESLVCRINERTGLEPVEIDDEALGLFQLCHQLYFLTRGAFDPTALPLIRLWDWKSNSPQIPGEASIQSARRLVGWNKVVLKPGSIFLPERGMAIDLGGIGKEFAVDRVIQIAQEHGLRSALVDFGQDVRAIGTPADKPAWHIGLEDPAQPGACWTGAAVKDCAIATSGDYLRKFESGGRRYGHILDQRTGYPVDNGCRSVSVIAPSCTIAGALSTSAFILGAVDGLRFIESYPNASGVIVTDDKRFFTRRLNEYLTH